VAESTPRRSYRIARFLSATRLYWNSPPDWQQNWGQVNPNWDNHHSDPMEISTKFWIPDIIDWWRL
jgi:hypothetical protein